VVRRRPLVTLTTDIGPVYAAQLKGVLSEWVPPGRIVELALELTPFGVEQAAFLFEHLGATFPAGTIHLAVVDPGVGGRRAPLAVRARDGTTLIGPDNGLLDRLALRLGVRSAIRLDRSRVTPRARVGATFDGRDLFAPAAGRLASGSPMGALGTRIDYRPRVPTPPKMGVDGWTGRLVHVDRFGNLITNLPSAWLGKGHGAYRFRIGTARWNSATAARTYEELPRGRFGLIPSSFGTLEVAVREGSARARLGVRADRTIRLVRAPARPVRRRDGK
jgi:S-adenosylmethionine hydrolase